MLVVVSRLLLGAETMQDKFKHVWWLFDKASDQARKRGKVSRPVWSEVQRLAGNELRFTLRSK